MYAIALDQTTKHFLTPKYCEVFAVTHKCLFQLDRLLHMYHGKKGTGEAQTRDPHSITSWQ